MPLTRQQMIDQGILPPSGSPVTPGPGLEVPTGSPGLEVAPLPPPIAAPPPGTPTGNDAGFGSGAVNVPPALSVAPRPDSSVVPLPSSVQPGSFAITPYRTGSFSPRRLLGRGRSIDMKNVFGPGIASADRPIDDEIMAALFGARR